jgi:hypothetical protein
VPPPRPVAALLRQLAAEHALLGALTRLPAHDDDLIRRLAARSRDRARRLSTAIEAEGGRPSPRVDDPGVAFERARAALAAHVTALPELARSDLRRLGADLVAESAADLALLGEELGEPAGDAFPGTVA